MDYPLNVKVSHLKLILDHFLKIYRLKHDKYKNLQETSVPNCSKAQRYKIEIYKGNHSREVRGVFICD